MQYYVVFEGPLLLVYYTDGVFAFVIPLATDGFLSVVIRGNDPFSQKECGIYHWSSNIHVSLEFEQFA